MRRPWLLRARRVTAVGMVAVIVTRWAAELIQGGSSFAPTPPMLVSTLLGTFFLLALGYCVASAVALPRPTPRLLLAGGLLLWVTGSATVTASGEAHMTDFPAPGEGFFLASYVLLAAAVLGDVPRRRGWRPSSAWLDAFVVCAGTVSLAGVALVTPIGERIAAEGLGALLALLYPMLDIALLVIVLAQVVLRGRRLTLSTGAIVTGFLCLAAADSVFVLSTSMTYVTNVVVDSLYGLAFGAIVVGLCARPTVSGATLRPRSRGTALVLASLGAVAVLALDEGPGHWYTTVPAIITLLAAGARLVLALREAQGAVEARRLSLTDDLTGIPNRRAVHAELRRRITVRKPVALMLLDLDGFKEVNDSLGHAAGDAVLIEVAARLEKWAGHERLVARLGGDEFAVVCRDDDEDRLQGHARALLDELQAPLVVDDITVTMRTSLGIAVHREGETEATDLMRQADVAMYDAKNSRSEVEVYDAARDMFSRARLENVSDLRRGIDDGELVIWYQPQVDALTRRVVAMEALVRWEHPTRGLLTPISFLPDARRSGLMTGLTQTVVTSVVEDAQRWRRLGLDFTVSFNCAPPELLGGQVLPCLFDALSRVDLPAEALLVEVTEDSFVADPERAREVLAKLRAHGVQTAIDDYGTGFSSLAYLRDLPVQELKIDRSFVSTLSTDVRSRVIVDSTRQMAQAIGLRVVAEGVEDETTADALVRMGVDALQGYVVARPMPSGDVLDWVAGWHAHLDEARAGVL